MKKNIVILSVFAVFATFTFSAPAAGFAPIIIISNGVVKQKFPQRYGCTAIEFVSAATNSGTLLSVTTWKLSPTAVDPTPEIFYPTNTPAGNWREWVFRFEESGAKVTVDLPQPVVEPPSAPTIPDPSDLRYEVVSRATTAGSTNEVYVLKASDGKTYTYPVGDFRYSPPESGEFFTAKDRGQIIPMAHNPTDNSWVIRVFVKP